jgi:hypothetical protein
MPATPKPDTGPAPKPNTQLSPRFSPADSPTDSGTTGANAAGRRIPSPYWRSAWHHR